jgi:hypothetical protein
VLSKLPFVRRILSRRRHAAVDRALDQVRRLPAGVVPARATISQLHAAWGNPEFIATVSYLEAVATHAVALKGHVLECGSGLSTLLLGVLADVNGFQVWTLEHNREWFRTLSHVLQRHKVGNVHLCFAPLRDFGGGVSWYDAPVSELPREFSLIVCDGPPNWKTPGGRYGLVIAMRERFAPSWNILLDDPKAAEKTGMLARLELEPGVSVAKHTYDDGAFLWITREPIASAARGAIWRERR